jgi:hypothetical protein
MNRAMRVAVMALVAAPCVALFGAPNAAAQTLITDDFSQNTLGTNWVEHQGAGTLKVENGVLQATAVTPDKALTHNASGALTDTTATLQVNIKSFTGSGTTGVVVKHLSPGNYIRLASTYSSRSLKITKFVDGVRTDLLLASGIFTLSPDTSYWVRGRTQGNVLTVEMWGRDPQTGGSPIVSRSFTLTGTDASRFGAGVAGRAGIYLDPGDTIREFDNLRIEGPPQPTTTRELVLNPTADTMVKQAQPKTAFGAATVLMADGQQLSTSGSAVRSYLKFNVPALAAGESISGASLSLNVTNATADGPLVYRTATGWTESGLTWSNLGSAAPRSSTTAVGDFGAMATGRISTSLSAVAAGQAVSLELAPEGTDGVQFSSREASTGKPQLVLRIVGG